MTRYADPSRCPDCQAPIPSAPGSCPSCGLPLAGPVAASLFVTLQQADRLLTQLRTTPVTAPVPVPGTAPSTAPMPPYPMRAGGAAPRRGLSGVSVPRILLTLGALCLLVAALTFLAVAWSWLGVGGRTAVLVGLTAVAGATSAWALHGRLRAAAEALGVVALGLLLLDVVGADDAGWLGSLSTSGLVVVAGIVLGTVSLAAALLARGRLVGPQVIGAAAWWAVVAGAADLSDHLATSFALGCAALLALAVAGRWARLRVFPWLALAAAATWGVPLVGIGVERMVQHESLRGLWVEHAGWPTVAAALLVAAPLLALSTRAWARIVFGGAAALLLTVTAAFPALDESTTQAAAWFLVPVAAWSLVALTVPAHWRAVAIPPMVGAALVPAAILLDLGGWVVDNAVGDPWTAPASASIPDVSTSAHPALLVVGTAVAALAVVALCRVLGWRWPARADLGFLVAALAVAATGTLAAYPVPVAVVAGCLTVISCALVGWATLDTRGRADAVAVLGVVGLLGSFAVAWVSVGLTALVLTAAAAALAWLWWRAGTEPARTVGAALLPVAVGGLLWTVGELTGLDEPWRAIPVLVVVGALAVWRARLPLELGAVLTAVVAGLASVGSGFEQTESRGLTALAVVLTLSGAATVVSSLVNEDRRLLAWPGGLLLAMATWVRLYDLGVTQPEAYTLPSAVALVLVGLWHLRRHPTASTLLALGPGLTLATVPSLLRVLVDDPVSLRALLLGLACLLLVMVGTRLHWTAPLIVGAVVGGLLVLREAGPYAAQVPSWLLIAAAGTTLTVVGITWERGVRDLRRGAAYLARLR